MKPGLKVIESTFSIHKFPPGTIIPQSVLTSEYFWIGRTPEEVSIVCNASIEIKNAESSLNWAAIKIQDILDFNLTGIISGISSALSSAGISLFALSTYNTDYFLVRSDKLTQAVKILTEAGYTFE